MTPVLPIVRERARLDVASLRKDFPALEQTVYGHPLAYLDNAATTQKPSAVIDRIAHFYAHENSNVHRGVHHLSQRATDAFEATRGSIARYLGVAATEVVFTSGTTGSINLVASGFSQTLSSDDEIVISALEHHSNIVPWQLACGRSGAKLRVIPVDDDGELDLEAFKLLLSDRTRLVAVTHTSNAIGTVNPIREMADLAHAAGAAVLVDAAQAFAHGPVNVHELDVDFLCFSGHKMFGPTGVGVLYGKSEALGSLPPWQGGGDMIETVSFESSTYAAIPHRFEAGTPNIAGVLGLGAAVEYLRELDWNAVHQHEDALRSSATDILEAIEGVRVIGATRSDPANRAPMVSFVYDRAHPYDIGTVLDRMGIAVRTGHHCAMPLMKRFDLPGTVRASFAFYNTQDDVAALADGMQKVETLFS